MWSVSSRDWVDSPRLHVHIDWLLDQLEERRAAVEGVMAGSADGDLFCFSEGSSSAPPSIPGATRQRAESLGMEIVIDHYDSFDD